MIATCHLKEMSKVATRTNKHQQQYQPEEHLEMLVMIATCHLKEMSKVATMTNLKVYLPF